MVLMRLSLKRLTYPEIFISYISIKATSALDVYDLAILRLTQRFHSVQVVGTATALILGLAQATQTRCSQSQKEGCARHTTLLPAAILLQLFRRLDFIFYTVVNMNPSISGNFVCFSRVYDVQLTHSPPLC